VAEKLGIEFRVVNLMNDYRSRIVEYLLAGYQDGITPNPDVMCNREIKFGVFLDYALAHGFDHVATGHYARVRHDAEDSTILRGLDPNKDQTYFLSLMQQHQARRALFPVGHLLKADVRAVAHKYGLPNAAKKDSQGICFIGNVKMSDFLRTYVPDAPGNIVDAAGKVLGQHKGVHLYTLGQRKGLGVASPEYKVAYVVTEKRIATRELVVALEQPGVARLFAASCRVGSLSWVRKPVNTDCPLLAMPRYRAPAAPARFFPLEGNKCRVEFEQAQRALAPGQICAFYEGEELLGGGIFEEIFY
jgi:tRNA-specific 2-thiouridylase